MDGNDALNTAYTNGQEAQWRYYFGQIKDLRLRNCLEECQRTNFRWGSLGLMGFQTHLGILAGMPGEGEVLHGEFIAISHYTGDCRLIYFGAGALHSFIPETQGDVLDSLGLHLTEDGFFEAKPRRAPTPHAPLDEFDPFAE